MFPYLVKPLDWFSIRMAKASVAAIPNAADRADDAARLLAREDFFVPPILGIPELTFTVDGNFHFPTPLPSPWQRNNRVIGKLYRAVADWKSRPTVILIHGWNAERGYQTAFPYLARRLNRHGMNAVFFQLPYHGDRKPDARAAVRNFLSDDLLRTVEAVRQSIAETSALIQWLEHEGVPSVALWGISLGSWLGGLVACHNKHVAALVMGTPVVRMDRLIAEIDFCELIHRQVCNANTNLERLNLVSHPAPLAPRLVLMIAGRYDLFAPLETVEELWHRWNQPDIWRTRHGHISMLMSLTLAERTVHWLRDRLSQ